MAVTREVMSNPLQEPRVVTPASEPKPEHRLSISLHPNNISRLANRLSAVVHIRRKTSTSSTKEPEPFRIDKSAVSSASQSETTLNDAVSLASSTQPGGESDLAPVSSQQQPRFDSRQATSSVLQKALNLPRQRASDTKSDNAIPVHIRDVLIADMEGGFGLETLLKAEYCEENYMCWQAIYKLLRKHCSQLLQGSHGPVRMVIVEGGRRPVSPALLQDATALYQQFLSPYSSYSVSIGLDTATMFDEALLRDGSLRGGDYRPQLPLPSLLLRALEELERSLYPFVSALPQFQTAAAISKHPPAKPARLPARPSHHDWASNTANERFTRARSYTSS